MWADVCIRHHQSSMVNVSNSSRSQKSMLHIIKDERRNSGIYILIQYAYNKSSVKYKVSDNLVKVYTKFVSEGKCTIRLKNPDCDILINADRIKLNAFLIELAQALKGNLSFCKTLKALPEKIPKPPQTRLTITKQEDYPVLNGFPRTLQSLQVINVRMPTFDDRILKMTNLSRLSLENNNLSFLPKEVGSLCLCNLNLKGNNLGTNPNGVSDWLWLSGTHLRKSLQILNLSFNKLSCIPTNIANLQLTYFDISNNEIPDLGHQVGRIKTLRILLLSNNHLIYVPENVLRLPLLMKLDVSYNVFPDNGREIDNCLNEVVSLIEMSARITHSSVQYSARALPPLVFNFLESAKYCVCSRPCFMEYKRKICDVYISKLPFDIAYTYPIDVKIPLERYYCSTQCFKSYGSMMF